MPAAHLDSVEQWKNLLKALPAKPGLVLYSAHDNIPRPLLDEQGNLRMKKNRDGTHEPMSEPHSPVSGVLFLFKDLQPLVIRHPQVLIEDLLLSFPGAVRVALIEA